MRQKYDCVIEERYLQAIEKISRKITDLINESVIFKLKSFNLSWEPDGDLLKIAVITFQITENFGDNLENNSYPIEVRWSEHDKQAIINLPEEISVFGLNPTPRIVEEIEIEDCDNFSQQIFNGIISFLKNYFENQRLDLRKKISLLTESSYLGA